MKSSGKLDCPLCHDSVEGPGGKESGQAATGRRVALYGRRGHL